MEAAHLLLPFYNRGLELIKMCRDLVYAVPADLGSGAAHCVHVVKMGAALRRLGLRVDVCVKAAPPEDDLTKCFGLPGRFEVTRIPMTGPGSVSLRFARGVLARSRKGESVLTRNLVTACLTALTGRRTVLELHSPLETMRERLLFRLFLRARGAVGLVTITHALKARFVDDFGPAIASRVHVLPDSADAVRLQTVVADGPPTVGYVGAFLPGKGADLLLRVAAIMPDVRFVLIGGAESDLPFGARQPNVLLPGILSHAEAMRHMARFDVALLPNKASVLVSGCKADIGRWTSPLKLFEYMAARRPIVASRLPVLQEVLTDGRNALLADPGDPEEWAQRIRSLLDDRERADALAATAHQDFVDHYSWDGRARRMVAILGLKDRP